MLFIILLFIVIPVVELSVLIEVGEVLGSWNTVALVLLTAIVGVSLVKSQGLTTLMQVQEKMAKGEMPGKQIVEAMLLAVAGIMLFIPGFVTDFMGLLLLTPFTRSPIAVFMFKRMKLRMVNPGQFQSGFYQQQRHSQKEDENVFDAEYEVKSDESSQLHQKPESTDDTDKNEHNNDSHSGKS